ncbi:MAG: Crp/Fnr family transcriptional regulator [Roseomonas sp.]|jgi:CRP-like cAMP-binding protein|nr:Crp/Fnr family transcriptional regulator [Roseomonas sp.]
MSNLYQLHSSANASTRNQLLAALPPEELAQIWPRLERVDFPLRQVVQAPEQRILATYFIETGWISMVALLADGGSAEVGHTGREGMVGLPLLFGSDTGLVEAMVQSPVTALRLSAQDFQQALEHNPKFRALLLRYALAFNEQVAQTAACNGRHVLEQRLARWLLMAHDRADGDEFTMTQDFLAMMLCVQRPGVTVAAQHLQKAGLIRYGRGRITITDRDGIERAACECYGTVRRRFEELLGNGGKLG